MGDFIYNLVFSEKPLWRFQSDLFVGPINALFATITIFMPNMLVFLSNLPKGFIKKSSYVVLWIGIYILIELFTTSIGMQTNFNGWNIWWSLLHNVIVFPLLILHTKNPILAWIIAFAFLGYIMYVFKVPALIMLVLFHIYM
jgi:hypothetical protein